jgi:hypothetical protein
VERSPREGPRTIPITGEITVANGILTFAKPIIGNVGIILKSEYSAVKHTSRAVSFVLSFMKTLKDLPP